VVVLRIFPHREHSAPAARRSAEGSLMVCHPVRVKRVERISVARVAGGDHGEDLPRSAAAETRVVVKEHPSRVEQPRVLGLNAAERIDHGGNRRRHSSRRATSATTISTVAAGTPVIGTRMDRRGNLQRGDQAAPSRRHGVPRGAGERGAEQPRRRHAHCRVGVHKRECRQLPEQRRRHQKREDRGIAVERAAPLNSNGRGCGGATQ
jgi:hypothetical protein